MTQLSAPTSPKPQAHSDDLYLNPEHTSPQIPVPDIATSMQNLPVTENPFADAYAPPSGPPPAQATVETPPSYDNLSINHAAPAHPIDEKSGSEWEDEKAPAPIENQRTAPIVTPPQPQSRGFCPISYISSCASSSSPPIFTQPPSFSRPAPSNLPYTAFAPITIYTLGKRLGDGFPTTLPPSNEPHPFASHDIQESDWLTFLNTIKEAGSLSGGEKIVANPVVLGIAGGLTFGVGGGITGVIIAKSVHRRMMKKKCLAIGELINIWNQTFFHPRKMEVVLAKGPECLSGPTAGRQGFPPDWEVESKKMEFGCGGCCGRRRRGREMGGETGWSKLGDEESKLGGEGSKIGEEGSKMGGEGSKLHRTTTGSSTASSFTTCSSTHTTQKETSSLPTSPTSQHALKLQKTEMKQALKTQCAAVNPLSIFISSSLVDDAFVVFSNCYPFHNLYLSMLAKA
ncbi:hypothetical protein JAAARDRAFT_67681 [Jaapia argillacea MUCL 33604]|uniref:Uncharacterized protein n=1 Tax=Jaapia argillacea MUCL 33604 TaxID=933084 RepID=A0A067Q930_9AGAM|nr:hypothetical protein JAAARDRAFT_67681 [Jaapia argillacea MUCL 33604]